MTDLSTRDAGYERFPLVALVTLRMLIGWHLLYEGLAKLGNPYWTSAGFLDDAKWWFGALFRGLAASPTAVTVVDALNEWSLTLIGLALLLGIATRTATLAAIVLLGLYYVAAPPLVGLAYAMPAEGSYLVVNKVLIEIAALVVLLALPTGHVVGLDRLRARRQGSGLHAAPVRG